MTRTGAIIAILLSVAMLGTAVWCDWVGGWYRVGTYVRGVFGGIGIATALWTLVVGQWGAHRE